MIEREVMRDESAERVRLACWFWRLAKTNFQKPVPLLDVKGAIVNCSYKSLSGLLPMKDLAGVKRLLQIKIRRGNSDKMHEQTFNAQRSTSNAQCLRNLHSRIRLALTTASVANYAPAWTDDSRSIPQFFSSTSF